MSSERDQDAGPLISCVMPTFGRPLYVDEAVAMFLRQDYPHRELIILNDCPGQKYRCDLPQVRVLNRPERFATLGEKRNAAIEMARGDLIAVWDDDDVYLPWRLSYSLGELTREGKGFYRASEFWAYWGEASLHDNQSVPGWVNHPNTLFTRDLWREVGGYPPQGVGEDAVFFERIHRHLKEEFLKTPLDPVDRFFVMRGTSHYHHMSINGGQHPLDTSPGEYRIEPKPIADPVLRQACEELERRRSDRRKRLPLRKQTPGNGGVPETQARTENPMPNFAWNGTTQTRIHGVPAQQNEIAAPLWESFFRISKTRYRAVEIGTGTGGFTRHIARFVTSLTTFDAADRWVEVDQQSDAVALPQGCRPDRRQIDVFSRNGQQAVIDAILRDDTPCILFCDGGNKALELKTFAPHLRDGDVVAVHDYWPPELDAEHQHYWAWREVTDQDFKAAFDTQPLARWRKADLPFAFAAWSVWVRML